MTKDSETTEAGSACESTELSGVKVLSYMPSHMGPGSAAKVCDDATGTNHLFLTTIVELLGILEHLARAS